MTDKVPLSPNHARFTRALEVIGDVQPEDVDLIAQLPLRIEKIKENQDVVREGALTAESVLLIEGLICRYTVLSSGQRQILSFHLPGDIPDLQSLHLARMDHGLGALTACTVAFISHDALRAAVERSPTLLHLLWRATLIDAAIFRQWIAVVGHRTAQQRVAHLICEIYLRMKVLGLDDGDSFMLPLTQGELADALGLSTVHINRTLRDLRAEGLIETRGNYYTVRDWPGLRHAGDFDPGYLHLKDRDAGR